MMAITRNYGAVAAIALAVGLATTGCGSSTDSGGKETSTAATTATSSAAAASQVADLPSLIPTPQATRVTKGPDTIADNGIHLRYEVDGAPVDVMASYKAALSDKGWQVTTIVSSGGTGGGGATYTGTHGDAYGVFDGGGYQTNTYIDVCVWPTKPAEPNCTRGGR